MVELISRISKGTRMDQIYIPKARAPGFELGEIVLIKPALQKIKPKPYYYNISYLEPIKNVIIEEILNYFEHVDNIIITGSFLEKGYDFEDIDVILVTDKKTDNQNIERHFKSTLGISVHIISMNFRVLIKGLNTDPLFQTLLSKFVSKKRVIFKTKNEVNYKLLDLHLLKSKTLMDNFDFSTGKEKYKMTRNLIAIMLFMNNKEISTETINNKINEYFGHDAIKKIKENMVKKDFLIKYRRIYDNLFKQILAGIKNGSKQK